MFLFLQVLDFLLFVGKFVLTFLLTAISFFVFSTKPLGLTYPWVPTVIVALITWLITASFFGVYTAAVDTLFLSFCKYDVKVIAKKIYFYACSHIICSFTFIMYLIP